MSDNKRYYRELKRILKKTGNRKRRQFFKKSLSLHPEESHFDEFQFNQHHASSWLNGIDEKESN